MISCVKYEHKFIPSILISQYEYTHTCFDNKCGENVLWTVWNKLQTIQVGHMSNKDNIYFDRVTSYDRMQLSCYSLEIMLLCYVYVSICLCFTHIIQVYFPGNHMIGAMKQLLVIRSD